MITNLKSNIWQLYLQRFGSCVYVIRMGQHNILIDTSSKENQEELLHELKKLKIEPRDVHYVLLTHNHFDHIGNLELFSNAKIISKELNIPHISQEICLEMLLESLEGN